MNPRDFFSELEHKIIRVLLLLLLVISCVKLIIIEVASLTH
jgi:hypothetical protein